MAYTIQEILSDEENTLRLYFDDIAESRPLSREREVIGGEVENATRDLDEAGTAFKKRTY